MLCYPCCVFHMHVINFRQSDQRPSRSGQAFIAWWLCAKASTGGAKVGGILLAGHHLKKGRMTG